MGAEIEDGFAADGEGPVRTIELDAFLIDEAAVAAGEFSRFVEETGHVSDAERFGWSYAFFAALLRRARDCGEKKTGHASEQARADVKAAREAWFDGQPDLAPKRLIFIDETGLDTRMARRRGRGPKGERRFVSIPHGSLAHDHLRRRTSPWRSGRARWRSTVR